MKLIKTYAGIAILNWILVSAVTLSVPQLRKSDSTVSVPVVTVSVSATPLPTPTPRKTVIHVKRVVVLEPTGHPVRMSTEPTSQSLSVQIPVNESPAPQQTAAPTPDTRCIITIDGVRYDVTQFRSMHSGGNIFTCNADMSAVFWSQHGQSTLNRMASYRI